MEWIDDDPICTLYLERVYRLHQERLQDDKSYFATGEVASSGSFFVLPVQSRPSHGEEFVTAEGLIKATCARWRAHGEVGLGSLEDALLQAADVIARSETTSDQTVPDYVYTLY